MRDINIKEWIKAYDNGDFSLDRAKSIGDFQVAVESGWYDTFNTARHCVITTQIFASKIKALAKSPKVNPETMYVWFKGNCPMEGSLYDDFRIADIASGNNIFVIEHRNGKWSAYGKDNEFEAPLVEGNWKEVKKWFLKSENDDDNKEREHC